MPDWRSIGYARGMGTRTGSMLNGLYPNRDIHSAEDEAEFIAGYWQALRDYDNAGYRPFLAYVEERG